MSVASEPQTPKKPGNSPPRTPRSHVMGMNVICATPHKGKRLDNYSLGDRLGKGAFAVVYKAIHLQTAEIAAIKQIPLEKIKSVDSIMGEIELLQELQHPNIVSYLGFMKDEHNLNIVLEYCENGSLLAILRKFGSFPENLVARYMRQVLDGLAYLHHQGTIHRDIKGANILTTKDGVAKLADFGVATRISYSKDSEHAEEQGVVGTPHWMAPEIIQMMEPTTACDIWSLGATIVELRTGKPPFGDRVNLSAMYAIVQQDSSAMIPVDSSASLRDFLTLCFQKDPSLRVSAEELLRHAWIKKFGEGERLNQIKSPEKTVKQFNSPSRRRKLAVPSKLNLKDNIFSNASQLQGDDEDEDDLENDFATLGVFGSHKPAPQPVKKIAKRQPLDAFVEHSEDSYNSDYESKSFSFSRNKALAKLQQRNLNSEMVPSPQENGELSADADGVSGDPFKGSEDFSEDEFNPSEANAQLEFANILDKISQLNVHDGLITAVLRLCELIQFQPTLTKLINEKRLLARLVSIFSNHTYIKPQMVVAFVQLTDLCISNSFQDVTIGFCIAGGLSFLISMALEHEQVAFAVLNLVFKMTCQMDTDLEDNMSISKQLTFRTDAVKLLTSFFEQNKLPEYWLKASSVVIKMFESCGPKYRTNLWLHFNQNNSHLFTKLTDLLHLDALNEDSAIQTNVYLLLIWFTRTPPEHLIEQVDQRSLRRLMRAYLKLPTGSPHRITLLEMFKNFSNLVPILDSLQRGNVAPHLITVLGKSITDKKTPEHEKRAAANCLVPALFNYCRIERSRQREVAKYGLLPILIECAKLYPALREFAYPVFTALVHASHEECFRGLWDANALQLFMELSLEPGWQAMAITSISTWLRAQPVKVKAYLLPHIRIINVALARASERNSDALISAVASLLDTHRFLLYDLPIAELFEVIQPYLLTSSSTSNASKIYCLQIIYRGVCENTRVARPALKESGLLHRLLELGKNASLPVPCKKLLSQILDSYRG